MKTVPATEAAIPAEDPALRFIRLELAPSRAALDRYSGIHRSGADRGTRDRHVPDSVPGAGLRRHPAADRAAGTAPVPPGRRGDWRGVSRRRVRDPAGGHHLRSALALLAAAMCGTDGAAGAFPRHCRAGAPSSWPRWFCPLPSLPTCPTRREQSDAALFNAFALAGTAWAVAAATAPFAPPATREEAPVPPGRRELVGFALLAVSAIGLQMLFYNTINLPEIRTGVIAVLLTADPDLRAVWRRMPLRQLCGASCAALALLMIAVGAPLMDDLGFFAVLAGVLLFYGGLGRAWRPAYRLCRRAGRGHRNARAVAGRPIYDRHRAEPLECRRGHVGISCYRADRAAAGAVGGAAGRTPILMVRTSTLGTRPAT